ncbi:hypothetical protein BDV95DRAFT_570647 [Massariosphaeria phaeospora]|uniref:N-acetyltransferase domain-containing protein n=1 Tax=Massariosphaeria phaeospora TaxID=100035 RepID=A0A7C8IB99_9PLEO|nr:hypothetical protein BDV95DRAFT_570647 [Massariosphaeria phaeospora]
MLPPAEGGDQQIRRVAYAVHELLDAPQGTGEAERPTRLVGLVNLMSAHGPNHLVLPEHLTIPASEESTTLVMELAYMLLPAAWGKGFAAEAVIAVFGECKNARAFWAPYEKVWVRAIVNAGNPASLKVMAKTPMREKGIYEWNGGERKVFLAGQWTNTSTLHIWGMHLLG